MDIRVYISVYIIVRGNVYINACIPRERENVQGRQYINRGADVQIKQHIAPRKQEKCAGKYIHWSYGYKSIM